MKRSIIHFFLCCICCVCVSGSLGAQNFLNGDFENNTAGVNQINLSNAGFNGFMSDVNGFGTTGNLDIINTSNWSGGPQCGLWFIALTGAGTDMIAMTLSAPLVMGNSYTITFYDKKDVGFASFPIEVGLSTTNNAFGPVIYTAPTASFNGVWTQRTFTFNAPNNGQYITVRQSAGSLGDWTQIDNFSFTNSGPNGVLGNDTTICSFPYTLDATTPNATYLWNNGSTQPTININGPGTYWVDVIVGCNPFRDSIIVTAGNGVPVDLGNDTTICSGPLLLDATTPNANSYLWNNGTTLPTLNVNTSGTYWVEVNVNGCTSRDTINITISQPNVLNLGNDTNLCTGGSVLLTAGPPGLNYVWQDGSTNNTFTVTQPGIYYVYVTAGNCQDVDSITVNYVNVSPVNLGPDVTACLGNTVTIDATTPNAVSYLWQNGATATQQNATTTGVYWVQVNVGGCTTADSINVTFVPPPPGNFLQDVNACQGDIIALNAPPGLVNYTWNNGATTASINVTNSGTYSVIAFDGICNVYDTSRVTLSGPPVVNLGIPAPLCEDSTITLQPLVIEPNVNYTWNTGATSPQLAVSTPGPYSLIGTTNCGSDTDMVIVRSIKCHCYLYIPNSFTANEDGMNEIFRPGYDCELKSYELKIFNRWGEQVFFSDSPNKGWDGFISNETKAPNGVYIYHLIYSSTVPGFDRDIVKRGMVNLIR